MLWMTRTNMAWVKKVASEVVETEFYNIIVCHSECHTGTRLSHQVTIEICVLRMCW